MAEYYIGDCLDVMRGMKDEFVHLVYLDPPFNTGKDWGAFNDKWDTDTDYHRFMRERLIEIKRVLHPTGSLYLHCDPTISHYLKVEMDWIFGRECFRNEIAWCYPPAGVPPKLAYPRKHDVILFYGKSANEGTFNHQYTPMTEKTRRMYNKVDEDGRVYKTTRGVRSYLDKNNGRSVPSWWHDIASMQQGIGKGERTGYPTQKPLKLLERIIKASSNEGDTVLDPFAGSGTTLVAAQKLGRDWMGIDVSGDAAEIAARRMPDVPMIVKSV